MASNGVIAHRFANRDYNKEKGLKGSSTSISGNNYYSYSTVFGQWVDEKVCLVYHGETSITSNKHMLWAATFPMDVVLFPYDDGGRGSYYNNWHGCDLLGWRGEFDYDARVRLMDYWVSEIYDALHAIVNGKGKDLDKRAERAIEEYWEYVEKLCSMYKDTTVPKWLKKKRIDMDGTWKKKNTIVKALYKGERDVRVLVDAAFGQGTYKKYYDYCARYRKAADKKAQMEWLCHRLGIGSPYVSYRGYQNRMSHEMSADDIRKLTAKERVELHFRAIAYKEYKEHENERKKKFEKNKWNAYRWVVGYEPSYDTGWSGNKIYRDDVHKCRNMFTGEEYVLPKDHAYGFYWANTRVNFAYESFQKSADKEQWIREFYSMCEEVQNNRIAISIITRANANKREKENRWDDDVYLLDERLTRACKTEEELRIVTEFIERQNRYMADKEAQRRAREIERKRQEEEKRREEEFQRQVKKEQIRECVERGAEGLRDLWRLHLTSIGDAEMTARMNGVEEDIFYFGGNVLLRFNLDKTHVESSKGVRVPVKVAKVWFRKVKQWHEGEKFQQIEWDTKGNGRYTVSDYRNDILTAGCHDIAYAEMERMYNDIINA